MNKAEKQLAQKLLAFYYSPSKNGGGFTREEDIILERWRVHKIINEDAFLYVTTMSSDHKEHVQNQDYPLHPLVMKDDQ